MKIKVSDLVARFLEEQGVQHVFLLSGGMMMHLLDSVSKSKKIRYVCNHHEQACAMAAEGNARWRNGLGVCLATSGPGATNTLTGAAGAWLDSAPVLFLTGQSRRTLTTRGLGVPEMRMIGTFEVDIVPMAHSITKYAVFVDDPKMVLFHLQKAVHLAMSGRPGPVLLDMPLDVQGAQVEESELAQFVPDPVPRVPADFGPVWEKLRRAKRPVLLAGHGVRVAGEAERFREWASRLGVPIVTTQLAQDLVPYEDPLYVGHVGLRGHRAGNFAVQGADLLLAIGCSLHVTTTGYDPEYFAPKAEKIWIDPDTANLRRNVVGATLTYPVMVGDFLDQAVSAPAVPPPEVKEWVTTVNRWKQAMPILADHPAEGDKLETYRLVDCLSDVLSGGETVLTDAGSLYYIVGQCFKSKRGQRVIVSGALGAMGWAIPAALGIAVENRGHPTICITGDGSMQVNVQELATVVRYAPNLKIIVINNDGYASIRNTQINFCNGHLAATDPSNGVGLPDWALLCAAYGIPHRRCDRFSVLADAFREMLAQPGPVFLECVVPPFVDMIPAVTSRKLADGTFVSSRLHEMSPLLSPATLQDLGVEQVLRTS